MVGWPPKKAAAREVDAGGVCINNAYHRAVCTQKLHTFMVFKSYGGKQLPQWRGFMAKPTSRLDLTCVYDGN